MSFTSWLVVYVEHDFIKLIFNFDYFDRVEQDYIGELYCGQVVRVP